VIVANIPRDDLGTQRLEDANAARGATAPVAPLDASAPLRPQGSPTPIPVAPPVERRRGERRRERERRGQHQATLLDTRSHHERRTHERRQLNEPQDEQRPLGINVYI